MKYLKLFCFTISLFSAFYTSVKAQNHEDYKLVWADEFNENGKLNDKDWNYEMGFVRNNEPQLYVKENAIKKGGCLVITAKKQRCKNPSYNATSSSWKQKTEWAKYTSSSVTTALKHELLYGRMEIRAKIPVFSGAWPAIWCLGNKKETGKWPACGEIDILEFYDKSILANVAWSDSVGQSLWNTKKIPFTHFTKKDKEWATKFHTWRMDWDESNIRLYLDDELLNTMPLSKIVQKQGAYCKVENPFRHPQYLILNFALRSPDGIDESQLPAKYYIDYVRFYERK